MTLIHGIVPRKCPTAFCAPSQQAEQSSPETIAELRAHIEEQNRKHREKYAHLAASVRRASQFSPRTRKRDI